MVVLAYTAIALAVLAALAAVVAIVMMLGDRRTIDALGCRLEEERASREALRARIDALEASIRGWHEWYRKHVNGGREMPAPPEPVDLQDDTIQNEAPRRRIGGF